MKKTGNITNSVKQLLLILAIVVFSGAAFAQAGFNYSCPNCQETGSREVSNLMRFCEDMKSRARWAQDWQCSNVAIYDEDQRVSITENRDQRIDGLSDVVGVGTSCNNTYSGVIVRRENDNADYVVFPAHAFFDRNGRPVLNKEGQPCSEQEMADTQFFPNMKYMYMGDQYREFAMKSSKLEWPPINLEEGRNWSRSKEDVLIFKIAKGEKNWSEDIMPISGKPRGYGKYFVYRNIDMNYRNFNNLTRVSFNQDSPRPLEQSYQTQDIQIRDQGGVIYDTSDIWSMASGSALWADFAGHTAILGHVSSTYGSNQDSAPAVRQTSTTTSSDWNRNTRGSDIAKKYNLESIVVDSRMASLKTQEK